MRTKRSPRPRAVAPTPKFGRPPLGQEARHPIALRLDTTLLAALREEAASRGIGYQTLIHQVLSRAVAEGFHH